MVSAVIGLLACGNVAHGQDLPQISSGERDRDGYVVHTVLDPRQAGKTEIKVLLPDRLEKDKRYPVIYVLPVEVLGGNKYGDGLAEIKRLDLHNKYGVICVLATFAHLPWYADHPTDRRIGQESYFLQTVLPFIEKTYPVVVHPRGRSLVGFSKSGWGAFSLLLRHPRVFAKAAAWDAPLAMTAPNRFGMGDIFGTQANFEQYRITELLKKQAATLGKEERLALVGTSNFRDHHQHIHEQMLELHVAHHYVDARQGAHTWHSGWLADAFAWLMR